MGGVIMDDYLARKLTTKRKRTKIETYVFEGDDEISENVTTLSQRTIEKLQEELQMSNKKYRTLQKQYIQTKEAMDKHALILANFSDWVNTLDLMLSEAKDAVGVLKDQIDDLELDTKKI